MAIPRAIVGPQNIEFFDCSVAQKLHQRCRAFGELIRGKITPVERGFLQRYIDGPSLIE
jgi:hypothetical protein